MLIDESLSLGVYTLRSIASCKRPVATCTLKPRGSVNDAHARGRTLLGSRRQAAVVTRPAGPAVRTVGAQRAVLLPTVHHFQHQPAETRSVLHYSRVRMKPGSKLTCSTNLFHRSLLAPMDCLLGLYWTGLLCSTVFHF